MSSKNTTQVIIAGKIYTMSGYESEEYLQRVAAYLNGKLSEFREVDGYHRLSAEMKGIMLDLNIADDYFKMKNRVEELERELSEKDKETYEFKQELITARIDLENSRNDLRVMEEKNEQIQKENIQLETKLKEHQK